MLPRRPVVHRHSGTAGSAGSNLSHMLQAAFPDELSKIGRETRGGARLRTQRPERQGRLVSRNKDFIRAINGPMGAVAKKKLEFRGNPGYPFPHIIYNLMSWAHGRGAAAVSSSVSPVLSYGLPVLPTQDGATPE
jgi:hypothetical protein